MPNMIGDALETRFHLGDIVAYRVWKVLCLGEHPNSITVKSLYYHLVWPPHTPVRREQDVWSELWDELQYYGSVCDPIQYYGLHAYKTLALLEEKFNCYESNQSQTFFYVIGRVRFWGEIIEHEDGYRAEHGQVLSIDSLPPDKYFWNWTPQAMRQIRKSFKIVQDLMN